MAACQLRMPKRGRYERFMVLSIGLALRRLLLVEVHDLLAGLRALPGDCACTAGSAWRRKMPLLCVQQCVAQLPPLILGRHQVLALRQLLKSLGDLGTVFFGDEELAKGMLAHVLQRFDRRPAT